tara:strand:+ start:502 stop:777 length:276 start_codon:yes stop_codon:yes gene_type:complete
MSGYKKVQTSCYVYEMIREIHKELKVFNIISQPDGDSFGNHDNCRMLTEYGFDGHEYPIIGTSKTWTKNHNVPSERINEKHSYWLCVAAMG